MPTLDVDAVRAFVTVIDVLSFTGAAKLLGSTQGAVSVKIKRLEDHIGHRLLERTPRSVRLSAQGAAFLEDARVLVAVHDRALASLSAPARRFALGIAAHAVGPELPSLLARLHGHDSHLTIEVQLDNSQVLMEQFDKGLLDAAILQREDDRRDGEILGDERYGWFAACNFEHTQGKPLRIATLSRTCWTRELTIKLLDSAGIAWIEVFHGGGASAVLAAVSAGVGVAVLPYRIAPPGAAEVSRSLGLPPIPSGKVVLHSALTDERSRKALKVIADAFRAHRTSNSA